MKDYISYEISLYDGERVKSEELLEAISNLSEMGLDIEDEFYIQFDVHPENSTGEKTVSMNITQDSKIVIKNLKRRDNIIDLRTDEEKRK